jgi:hypothetical protein
MDCLITSKCLTVPALMVLFARQINPRYSEHARTYALMCR